jgi:hypothetical protein
MNRLRALLAVVVLLPSSAVAAQELAALDPSMTQRKTLFPFRTPIPVVYAAGKPYERGVQIGRQLRALDPHMLKEVTRIRWGLMMRDIPNLTREDSTSLIHEYLRRVKAQIGAEIVDEYIDEMRGVGDGAGVSFNEMFMLNLGGHYRHFFIDERGYKTPYDDENDGCSSFAAWGKATKDGKMIATHNCDWPRTPDRSMMVAVVMAPERGNRLVYAAPIGTWGSHHISSDRLFIAGLALGVPKAKARSVVPEGPNGMLQRWIAQYANSAGEAWEMLREKGGVGDRGVATPAGSLVYVDEKEAIYLQTAPDKIARIPNQDGYNAVTNHVVLDEMKPHFVEGTAYSEGSVNRLNTVTHFVKHFFGRIDHQSAATIMSSHYDFATGRENVFAHTPCQHGEYRGSASGTNLSTIVKLEEDTVWLALGNPCVGTYTRIRIGSREEIADAAKAALLRTAPTSSQQ